MPPTMIETFGVPEASSPEAPDELLRPQAAVEVARVRASAVAASRPVVRFILFSWVCGQGCPSYWVSGGVVGVVRGRQIAPAWLPDGGRHDVRRRSRRVIS